MSERSLHDEIESYFIVDDVDKRLQLLGPMLEGVARIRETIEQEFIIELEPLLYPNQPNPEPPNAYIILRSALRLLPDEAPELIQRHIALRLAQNYNTFIVNSANKGDPVTSATIVDEFRRSIDARRVGISLTHLFAASKRVLYFHWFVEAHLPDADERFQAALTLYEYLDRAVHPKDKPVAK